MIGLNSLWLILIYIEEFHHKNIQNIFLTIRCNQIKNYNIIFLI